MEKASCEKLCPDCPRRRGVARIVGNVSMWWARKTFGIGRIDRGDCIGTVPRYGGAPNGVATDSTTGISRRDEIWLRSCPDSIPENAGRIATDEIYKIFRANPHINVFVDSVITVPNSSHPTIEQTQDI